MNTFRLLQISPISEDKIQLAKQNFPNETGELLRVSEFIDILPSSVVSFRRAVSVKLPLPIGFDAEDDTKVRPFYLISQAVTFSIQLYEKSELRRLRRAE